MCFLSVSLCCSSWQRIGELRTGLMRDEYMLRYTDTMETTLSICQWFNSKIPIDVATFFALSSSLLAYIFELIFEKQLDAVCTRSKCCFKNLETCIIFSANQKEIENTRQRAWAFKVPLWWDLNVYFVCFLQKSGPLIQYRPLFGFKS